jgi:hypothetical protein
MAQTWQGHRLQTQPPRAAQPPGVAAIPLHLHPYGAKIAFCTGGGSK